VSEDLRGIQRSPPVDAAIAAPDPLLEALGSDPVTLDALLARTGWPAAELSAKLLDLELDGAVARLPGGLYQRRHAG
jgi:DNA processing protein